MKTRIVSRSAILVVFGICLAISPAVNAAGNDDALKTQKYGPAPAYDPPKGTYVNSEAPNAISTATNPNPEAYKYTKQYQAASPQQKAKVNASVAAHQAILGQIRGAPKPGASGGPVTAGAVH
jgi:hypothetical protein